MLTKEIRIPSLCAGLRWRLWSGGAGTDRSMNQTRAAKDLQHQICRLLAGMLPSTAEEIAAAAAADASAVTACLDELAQRCRVMFNPLTKRYSLPRVHPGSGLAA